MIVISFEKDAFNRRFIEVRVGKQKIIDGVLYKDQRTPVMSGYYLRDYNDIPSQEINETVKAIATFDNLVFPLIVFNGTGIWREPTEAERKSTEAIMKKLNTKIERPNYGLSDTLTQVANFNEALEIVRDEEKIKEVSILPVDSVACIELDDTEGDFILSQEAEHIAAVQAPNGNIFNIYKLW